MPNSPATIHRSMGRVDRPAHQHPANADDSARGRHFTEIIFSEIINYCFRGLLKSLSRKSLFLRSLKVQRLAPLRMVGELNRDHRVRSGEGCQNGEVPTFVLEECGNLHFRAQLKGRADRKILNVAARRNEIPVDMS